MDWLIISIIALLLVLGATYIFLRKSKALQASKAGGSAWAGGAIGSIIGVSIGIALVEFAGFDYPFPIVTLFLGSALGQVCGLLYERRIKKK
ncbi:MAG: hypothetical protein V1827_06305 [Candidatus Micrarchaeota archaeon]